METSITAAGYAGTGGRNRQNPRDHGVMVATAAASPRGVGPEIVQQNRLLAALPVAEQRRLAADLAVVDLDMRDQIYDIDATITEVYFPLTCVLSIAALADGDVAVEVATIGFEGMAGLPVFLGTPAS